MKLLYLECGMGADEKMLLAALYELLEDKGRFLQTMNSLGLPCVHLEAESAVACGVAGTRMCATGTGAGAGVRLEQVLEQIDCFPLPEEVLEHIRKVYQALALVSGGPEAFLGQAGEPMALVSVAGVCYALSLLKPDRITASPVHVGSGMAYGVPVPAPETAALLTGVPICGDTVQGELCTPAGAALLVHFVQRFGPLPMMAADRVGCGISGKTQAQAGCLRAFLGQAVEEVNSEIAELVCSIDDMSPEAVSSACASLLELGAVDVYTVSGTMKKDRPGFILTVLCRAEYKEEMAQYIMGLTTASGIRVRRCRKYFPSSNLGKVETKWGTIRLKLTEGLGMFYAKPNQDDVIALAQTNGVSCQEVLEDALCQLKAWRETGRTRISS